MQQPQDPRYSDQKPTAMYEDAGTRYNDRIYMYNLERQRNGGLHTDKNMRDAQPAKSVAVNSPQRDQQNVMATCATCLSDNSLAVCPQGIFCYTCNRSALIPRVDGAHQTM